MKSREFLRWQRHLRKHDAAELKRREKIEWYLAQIAYWIATTSQQGRRKRKYKLGQFLFTFDPDKSKPKKKESGYERGMRIKALLTAHMVALGGKIPKD